MAFLSGYTDLEEHFADTSSPGVTGDVAGIFHLYILKKTRSG